MSAWGLLGLACAWIAGPVFYVLFLAWMSEMTREANLEEVIKKLRRQKEDRRRRQWEIDQSH